MAAASSAADIERRTSITSGSAIRPSIRSSRPPVAGSPHTPQQRQIISPYTGSSSPGSSFRHEEDAVIIEVGARYLRAGFEGDSRPMCTVQFGPEESRRVGDYRNWIITGEEQSHGGKTVFKDGDEWSENYELWRNDIRNLDIGLFEDKLERAIREIYNKYLLTNAGSSRLVLVLPSIVPHPLLSSLISTIFNRWRYPSITLLPSAAMAAVSAGLRSALVIDIGWEETVVTGLYEYREIQSRRSTRAMKLVMSRLGVMLTRLARERDSSDQEEDNNSITVSFGHCEEILTRLSWCRQSDGHNAIESGAGAPTEPQTTVDSQFSLSDREVSLPIPDGDGGSYTTLPFSKFSEPVEEGLFAGGFDIEDLDDEEMPIDMLAYETLLSLPPDVRASCMSRIIFVGGGSNIPGIRRRTLNSLDFLIKKLKWRVTKGKAIDTRARQLQEISGNQQQATPDSSPTSESKSQDSTDESSNFIDEKLKRDNKDSKPAVQGVVREVESLGSWAGASLVASLKVRGVVEIEREKFLQHGFSGATRDLDLSMMPDRRSIYGSGVGRPGGDRSSWTLGEWG